MNDNIKIFHTKMKSVYTFVFAYIIFVADGVLPHNL